MESNLDKFNLLRKIGSKPNSSQRQLASELGFSLGKLNYCLKSLKDKGFDPVILESEHKAKSFDIEVNPEKYPIFFFKTDTSGEKTYEEFYCEDEDYEIDLYHSLGYVKALSEPISENEIISDFDKVFEDVNSRKQDIIKVIKKYVPNFVHIETGKHLDQKM